MAREKGDKVPVGKKVTRVVVHNTRNVVERVKQATKKGE